MKLRTLVLEGDREGKVLRRETVGSRPGYVNRLGGGLYAKAQWRGDAFVITERFGKEVFRTGV